MRTMAISEMHFLLNFEKEGINNNGYRVGRLTSFQIF